MTAGLANLVIEAGAQFTKSILWQGPSGSPIDLTGYTAAMMVRSTVTSATTLLSIGTATGEIVLGGVAGTIVITVSGAVTATLAAGTAVYDLVLTPASGQSGAVRLLTGSVVIEPGVTR